MLWAKGLLLLPLLDEGSCDGAVEGADDADGDRGAAGQAEGVADGDRPVADLEAAGVAELGDGQVDHRS